jgi:hypothetical protein
MSAILYRTPTSDGEWYAICADPLPLYCHLLSKWQPTRSLCGHWDYRHFSDVRGQGAHWLSVIHYGGLPGFLPCPECLDAATVRPR